MQAGEPPDVDAFGSDRFSDTPRATFVTLEVDDALAGCLGHVEPIRPIDADVVHNAYGAAFRDPRFSALQPEHLRGLDIHISLLSPLEPLDVETREALLRELEPGRDGLLIEEGDHRGTFLPSVWDQCPDPRTFLQRLNLKADLPADYWSPNLEVYRYTVEEIDRDALADTSQ